MNLERNQFGRKSGEPVELPLGISVFNYEVATLDVTEVTQSLMEGLARLGIRGQVLPQPAYSSDLGRLLGVRGDRPRGSATKKPDELPPLHSTLPQLEDTGSRYQVSWLIACNSVGIAASQSAHVTQFCVGSISAADSLLTKLSRCFGCTSDSRLG